MLEVLTLTRSADDAALDIRLHLLPPLTVTVPRVYRHRRDATGVSASHCGDWPPWHRSGRGWATRRCPPGWASPQLPRVHVNRALRACGMKDVKARVNASRPRTAELAVQLPLEARCHGASPPKVRHLPRGGEAWTPHAQGKSDLEIVAVTGISRSHVSACLHEARKRLGIATGYGELSASASAGRQAMPLDAIRDVRRAVLSAPSVASSRASA